MRELRVEDALLYLDQVKVEFGDRPHIYNEFLDIMKTFKTQQIDTPGVIRRVSNLFQGNRRLVLGFNTFLPEGYKIEIDGEGPPVAVYRAPGSNEAHVLRESAESQAVNVSAAALAARPDGTGLAYPTVDQMGARLPTQEPVVFRATGGQQQQPHQQQIQQHHSNQANDGGIGASLNKNNVPRQMMQATKVLLPHDAGGVAPRFQQQHQQQQQFMEQQQQQSQPQPQPQYHQQQLPGGVAPRLPQKPPKRQGMPQTQQRGINGQPPPMPHQSLQMQQQAAAPSQRPAPTGFADASNSSPGQPPMEFDHAINYVTTIKRRFHSEPETYKKFLEILHTYQKEQRGIKEVLDEVSELFEEHPDLLKEFTFFLPDAVQAQAKAQLDQAAKEAEARKRSKAKAAIMNTAQGMQRKAQSMRTQATPRPAPPVIHSDAVASPSGGIAYPQQARSSIERENDICRGAQYGVVMFDPVRPPRKNSLTPVMASLKNGRPTSIPELPTMSNTTEAAFFERAKAHLNRRELSGDKPIGSRKHTPYTEFLKCLHLYGADVLTNEELVMLLKHLFVQGHAPKSGANATGGNHNPMVAQDASELIRDFEEILVERGPYAKQQQGLKDKSSFGLLRTQDFDFSHSENPTPSYWAYPANYPHSLFLSHPGQTNVDSALLNKSMVCVDPNIVKERSMLVSTKRTRNTEQQRKRKILSIEESDSMKQRRNICEEALAEIEEERYEADMAIERNVHALRRIEPFAIEAQTFREQEEKDGQPIGRLRYQLHRHSLNTIHINAIARIYNERGDEVLQHLLRNPLVVLPIVYQRLKQKDNEWRKVKAELTDHWNEISASNYEGSMDVQCYSKRRALEKAFTASRLLEECKRARFYAKHSGKVQNHVATHPFMPIYATQSIEIGSLLYQPYVETRYKVDIAHKHAFQLIVHKIKSSLTVKKYERERVGRILAEFLTPWFQYPTYWVSSEVRESFGGKLSPNITKFAIGQRVATIFGEGMVAAFIDYSPASGPKYRIKLSFGVGHLSPSAILYALPSKETLYVRRDGIMVRDESSLDTENSDVQLDSKYQLLFGTEKIFLFLRMYTLVCSILSDTREYCLASPPPADPVDSYVVSPSRKVESRKSSFKLDFTSVIAALENVFYGKMNSRDFEALGRKLTKEKVHQIAALPKLVERCAEALLKMAAEDTILLLHDYCNNRGNIDPVARYMQCLSVVPDASYRIQLDLSACSITYCFIEKGVSLLTVATQTDDATNEDDINVATGDDVYHMEEEEEAVNESFLSVGHNRPNGGVIERKTEPQTKRVKVE